MKPVALALTLCLTGCGTLRKAVTPAPAPSHAEMAAHDPIREAVAAQIRDF